MLTESRLDVLEVFDLVDFVYYNMTDRITRSNSEKYWLTNLTSKMMRLDTRPSYPADKLTFTIDNITRNRDSRFLNVYLTLNGQFGVDLILEDSKRIFSELFE